MESGFLKSFRLQAGKTWTPLSISDKDTRFPFSYCAVCQFYSCSDILLLWPTEHNRPLSLTLGLMGTSLPLVIHAKSAELLIYKQLEKGVNIKRHNLIKKNNQGRMWNTGRKTVPHIKVVHLEVCLTRPSKSHRFTQHPIFNLEIDSEMTKESRILSYGIFIHYVLIDEHGLNWKCLCRVIRCTFLPSVIQHGFSLKDADCSTFLELWIHNHLV